MTRDDVPMRTDAEILEEARRLAREAVDAMVRFLVDTDTDLTGAQLLFKEPLSELRQRGDVLSREASELLAALPITHGAQAARQGVPISERRRTRDDVPMRTDAEILEEARRLAREAVDAMVRFLVGTDTDLTGAQRLFKEPLSELRQRGDILSRETWELHAALQVTFGARAARR